jgi:hypothetical protein
MSSHFQLPLAVQIEDDGYTSHLTSPFLFLVIFISILMRDIGRSVSCNVNLLHISHPEISEILARWYNATLLLAFCNDSDSEEHNVSILRP